MSLLALSFMILEIEGVLEKKELEISPENNTYSSTDLSTENLLKAGELLLSPEQLDLETDAHPSNDQNLKKETEKNVTEYNTPDKKVQDLETGVFKEADTDLIAQDLTDDAQALFAGEERDPSKDIIEQDSPSVPDVHYPTFKGKIKKAPINQENLKKPTLGCTDVLMGSQIYSDPTVNLAFTYVYTLCLMELSIQKYLQSQEYLQHSAKGLLEPGKQALRDLQKILPSYLLGFKTLKESFHDGNLRQILDNARKAFQEKQSGIGL